MVEYLPFTQPRQARLRCEAASLWRGARVSSTTLLLEDRGYSEGTKMKRVLVVGPTGSGKTTFAKKLSLALDAPHIEIDKLFWRPNWQQPDDSDFFPEVTKAIQAPAWVLDGNYNRTNHLAWPLADTVIWLDYPFRVVLTRSLKRAVGRSFSGKELWEGTGNRETFRQSFFSNDSILLWLLKSYRPLRQRYLRKRAAPENAHIRFVRLRSSRAAERLLRATGQGQT